MEKLDVAQLLLELTMIVERVIVSPEDKEQHLADLAKALERQRAWAERTANGS